MVWPGKVGFYYTGFGTKRTAQILNFLFLLTTPAVDKGQRVPRENGRGRAFGGRFVLRKKPEWRPLARPPSRCGLVHAPSLPPAGARVFRTESGRRPADKAARAPVRGRRKLHDGKATAARFSGARPRARKTLLRRHGIRGAVRRSPAGEENTLRDSGLRPDSMALSCGQGKYSRPSV